MLARALRLGLLTLLVGACAGRPSTPPRDHAATPAADRPLFEFHSGPWINLHQRLLAEATSTDRWHTKVATCACARSDDGTVLPAWTASVAGYKRELEGRSPVFDGSLQRTNVALALAGTSPQLPTNDIDPSVAKWIPGAFEPYFRGAWPSDDARNQAWVAAARPLVAKWGPGIARELAHRFGTQWPSAPIRVEVTQFAGFGGAYTTADPILVTISSEDPGYAGPAALEMLFHEASHGLDGILTHELQMAFIGRGKRPPRSLDHVIIFYTAGELVRRRLGASYVPYAYKQGVYARGWQKLEAAVRAHWQPWLDDVIDRETALSRLADTSFE